MRKLQILMLVVLLSFLSVFTTYKLNSEKIDISKTRSEISYGKVSDIDGNVYRTVKIGDQWWMAENLRVTHNPEGKLIESYAPNGDPESILVYGRLYSWNVAMNGTPSERTRGIAPKGWHIPNNDDWQVLFDHLGGVDIAGGKMKEAGTLHWREPNVGATNSSGFSAVPSGGLIPPDKYHGFPFAVHYLSSTGKGSNASWPSISNSVNTKSTGKNVYILSAPKNFPVAIRCVKD